MVHLLVLLKELLVADFVAGCNCPVHLIGLFFFFERMAANFPLSFLFFFFYFFLFLFSQLLVFVCPYLII